MNSKFLILKSKVAKVRTDIRVPKLTVSLVIEVSSQARGVGVEGIGSSTGVTAERVQARQPTTPAPPAPLPLSDGPCHHQHLLPTRHHCRLTPETSRSFTPSTRSGEY